MQPINERPIAGAKVLITGSQRGLGLALVDAFLMRGAHIYAGHRSLNGVPETLDRPGISPIFIDLENTSLARLPDVDFVINNAGVNYNCSIEAPDAVQTLRRELSVNVLGTFSIIHHYLPQMTAKKWGGFINIVSDLALSPHPSCATYSATKAALHSLCRSLQQIDREGIFALNIYPNAIDTRLTEGLSIPKLTPQFVAEKIIRAWEKGESELLI